MKVPHVLSDKVMDDVFDEQKERLGVHFIEVANILLLQVKKILHNFIKLLKGPT